MNSHRSNYARTINVLREIASGLHENEIKSKLFLSRYSYNYTISRLLTNGLIDYENEKLVVSRKGYNVLNFEREHPGEVIVSYDQDVISPLPDLE